MNYRVALSSIPWESPKEGVQQKIHIQGNQRIRILRFKAGFAEDEWCTSAHIGYVLQGEMTLHFTAEPIRFMKGDALWIDSGEAHKHKIAVPSDTEVELLLFEYL